MKSENKYKSIDAERFINAVSELIKVGFAKSFKEIAEKVGSSSQDFTDIKSGKKDLQRKFLSSVSNAYPISEVYVFTGKEPILNAGDNKENEKEVSVTDSPQNELDYYKSQLEMIRELLKEKEKYINMIQPLADQALKEMLERSKTK